VRSRLHACKKTFVSAQQRLRAILFRRFAGYKLAPGTRAFGICYSDTVVAPLRYSK
jgi:hypothetical protein